MLYYNPFLTMTLPEPTTELFRAVSLIDQIRNAMDTGIVMESVPVAIAFDEEVDGYDPQSNIREGRLELYEQTICNLGRGVKPDPRDAIAGTPAPPVPDVPSFPDANAEAPK